MPDSDRPRIIAGFGRSGTTWVQDVLATANSLRAVFEPLHPDVNIDAASHAHAYRNAGDADPELYSFLGKYLYDDFQSMWVDYRIRTDLLVPRADDLRSWQRAKRKIWLIARAKDNYIRYRSQRRRNARITKLVRANMMLPWLQKSFDARIVFLIRHPVAVVMSQMSHPEVWKPFARIDRYRADPDLLDALHKNTRELVLGQLDEVEAFALSWCVENSIALRQARDHGITVIFYEDLLEYGEPEWRRIMTALELENMPDDDLVNLPSQQAWRTRARDPMQNRRDDSWLKRIEPRTAERIQKILNIARIKEYSVNQSAPIKMP